MGMQMLGRMGLRLLYLMCQTECGAVETDFESIASNSTQELRKGRS